MSRFEVIIVIGTLNEVDTIRQVLEPLSPYHVILVDGGSTDGTPEIASRYEHVAVCWRHGISIAEAYVEGFRLALKLKPNHIVQMDAGLSHDPADVPRLISAAEQGYDLVIGSRFMTRRSPFHYRTAISLAAAWLMHRLRVPITDATSGFRCWWPVRLSNILNEATAKHHVFQFQLAYWGCQHCTVKEIPIAYKRTNSHFKPAMLLEAMRVYADLYTWQHRTALGKLGSITRRVFNL